MFRISSDKGGAAGLCDLIKFPVALIRKKDFQTWLCNDGYAVFYNGLKQAGDLPFGKPELWPTQDFVVFIKDAVIVAGSEPLADHRV